MPDLPPEPPVEIAEPTGARKRRARPLVADGEVLRVPMVMMDAATRDVAALDALRAEHARAIAALQGQMAAMASNMAALRDAIPDAATLDGMVEVRAAVIDAARKILGDGFDPKGKSDADIRRAAVAKRLGHALVDGKTPEQIEAAFLTVAAVAGPPPACDPLRDAMRSARPVVDAAGRPLRQAAHDEYVQHIRDAWKGDA